MYSKFEKYKDTPEVQLLNEVEESFYKSNNFDKLVYRFYHDSLCKNIDDTLFMKEKGSFMISPYKVKSLDEIFIGYDFLLKNVDKIFEGKVITENQYLRYDKEQYALKYLYEDLSINEVENFFEKNEEKLIRAIKDSIKSFTNVSNIGCFVEYDNERKKNKLIFTVFGNE